MQLRSNNQFANYGICLLVIIIFVNAYSVDAALLQNMVKRAVDQYPELPPEQKTLISNMILNKLPEALEISGDKEGVFNDQFSYYLHDEMPNLGSAAGEELDFNVDVIAWSLKNYYTLPSINEQDRAKARQVFMNTDSGVRLYIQREYVDTPRDIQNKIADLIKKKYESMRPKIGNYFFPSWLRISGPSPEKDVIYQHLKEHPFLSNKAKAYESVKTILGDTSLPMDSRKVHVDFFINREANLISSALLTMMLKSYDLELFTRDKQYIGWTKEMYERGARIAALRSKEAERAVRDHQSRSEFQRIKSRIMQDAPLITGDNMVLLRKSGTTDTIQVATSVVVTSITKEKSAYVSIQTQSPRSDNIVRKKHSFTYLTSLIVCTITLIAIFIRRKMKRHGI
ncbi:hypothetical protein LLG95_09675 [bacterium]|nr:hypothetical protein [bacterium]